MFEKKVDNRQSRGRFTRRTILVGFGQTALMSLLAGRLYQLQISESSRFRQLADQNRIGIQTFAPARGRIFDRNGLVLADNIETRRLVIIPDLAGDLDNVLDLIGRIIPISRDERAEIVKLSGRQNRRIPIVVKSGLSWRDFAQINVMIPQLSGVETDRGFTRFYPQGPEFGHLTGYVGAVERFEIDGDPALYLPGMRVGKAGVELGFEKRLRGRGGKVEVEIDAKGHILRKLDRQGGSDGTDIRLSIDGRLQRRAMHRLRSEKRASVVAMDVRTGEVIVMASNPSYDPQKIASGISRAEWSRLISNPDDPLNNRAIRGQYPPGSTYKMVTALAALEAGIINDKTRFYCSGSMRYADQTYRCWKPSGHRRVRLHKALRESCDVYFYEIARRLGINALSAMARRLGLGQIYDFGLPDQKPGLIPDEDWKIARFNRGWLAGETILAGIGQGYVLSTPLQLAVMTARLATGRKVVPRLIKSDLGTGGAPPDSLGLDEKHLEYVRRGMFAAVNEAGGTGSNAQLPFGNILVSGKTGTSQVRRKRRWRHSRQEKWEDQDHALFVSYFPASKPRYAVAVVVDHGGSGGKAAAPVARDIMTDLALLDPSGSLGTAGPPASGSSRDPSGQFKPDGEPA